MPSEEKLSKDQYGPMSLQMGTITHAVGDMIMTYEQLIDTLPRVAENVAKMQDGVELMYKQTEERANQMVETFKFLGDMSSQVPELQKAAHKAHTKALRDTIKFDSEAIDQENMKTQSAELERIKIDLLSMAQERVVIEVLTRDIVQAAQYSRRVLQGTTVANRLSAPARAVVTPSGKNYKVVQTSTVAPAYDPASLTERIHIPEFVPSSSSASNKTDKSPTRRGSVPSKYARSVGSGQVVPNLQHTSALPSELKDIKVPTSNMLAMNPHKPKRRRKSNDQFGPFAKTIVNRFGQTEQEVELMREQLIEATKKFNKVEEKSLKKMKSMKEMLERQQQEKDQALLSSVGKVLKEAVDTFQSKIEETDAFRLLKGLTESNLLDRDLSALEQQPRQQESLLQGKYKVMTVSAPPIHPLETTSSIPQPSEGEPVTIVRLSSPAKQRPPTPSVRTPRTTSAGGSAVTPHAPCTVSNPFLPSDRVYHVTLEDEEVEEVVPPPPAAPPAVEAPAPVEPPVVVVPPAAAPSVTVVHNGVEKELIQLLHNVVETQNQTMNGNQALLLTLIQNLGQLPSKTEVIDRSVGDESVESTDLPVSEVPPAVVQSGTPAGSPPASPKRTKNTYNTNLAEVLMEGDLMHGPYAFPTKPHTAPILSKPKIHTDVTLDPNAPKEGPRLRIVAGPELMRDLNRIDPPKEAPAAAPAVAEAEPKPDYAVTGLLKLIARGGGGGGAEQPAVTPEFIAKAVQDGVNRGVKDALGFLENVPPLEEIHVGGKTSKRLYHRQEYDVFLSRAAKPRAVVDGRDCSLYKMVRTAGTEDREINPLLPPGLIRINEDHRIRQDKRSMRTGVYTSGDERDDEEARRDPIAIGKKHPTMTDEEILRDIQNSQRHTEHLLDRDLCCSFDDSLSLTEDAAALLGEDQAEDAEKVRALYRPSFRSAAGVGESVESHLISEADSLEINLEDHQILYRSKLTKDVVKYAREQSIAQRNIAGLDAENRAAEWEEGEEEEHWYDGGGASPGTSVDRLNSNVPPVVLGAGPHPPKAGSQFKPLVSRVLDHQATEDILYRRDLSTAFSEKASRAVNAFERHSTYSDNEGNDDSLSDDDSQFERLKQKIRQKARLHRPSSLVAETIDGVDESQDNSTEQLPLVSGNSSATVKVEAENAGEEKAVALDESNEAEDLLEEQPTEVHRIFERETKYSAVGVETQNKMFASNHLPAEFPIGSTRRPRDSLHNRPHTHRTELEKNADEISRQVGRSQNNNRLLVNPMQVIDVQRGYTKASVGAGDKRRSTAASAAAVVKSQTGSRSISSSSGSSSFSSLLRKRDDRDSFDRSMVSASSDSSSSLGTLQSTGSTASSVVGLHTRPVTTSAIGLNSSRPVAVTSSSGASAAKKGEKKAAARVALADQHMIDLLGKERSLGYRSQSTRNENLISNYVGKPRGTVSAASSSWAYGREFGAGRDESDLLSSRDDSVNNLNVTGSTDSSVADVVKGPSRLLTVGRDGGGFRVADKAQLGRVKSWR